LTTTSTTTTDDGAIRTGAEQRPDARRVARLDWFRDARFGMFIHWGLYALPAGEWQGQAIPGIGEWIMLRARIPVAEYERLAERFNPVTFDAEAWASLAAQAGAKYLVITAKHHDGFCMYGTRVGDYNIVDRTPFGRDPMHELAAACQRHGVRLCFYYSQTQDWHHRDGDGNDWDYDESKKDFDGYVENYVKPQVRELLTNYGPIGLIWFDTPKRMTPEQSRGLVDFVHAIQPDCLVNGRIGNGLGDYAETGDNRIPTTEVQADWETPATINDTWGFKRLDNNWKSPADLVHKLVDIASKGGNYLLNVGPTAEGVIPQPSVERMQAIGAWLKTNGEAVYGTRPGPLQGIEGYRTTRRGSTVLLHVFDWPADGIVRMPALPGALSSPRLLANGTPLEVQRDGDGWQIRTGAASAPDPLDTVLALELST
jgi:alpha-L-fucosidase